MLSAFVALESENFILPIFLKKRVKEKSRSLKFPTWANNFTRVCLAKGRVEIGLAKGTSFSEKLV